VTSPIRWKKYTSPASKIMLHIKGSHNLHRKSRSKIKKMEKNNKICNFCGKEAVVWYQQDMLCENCWEGIKFKESNKIVIPNKRFKFSDLAK